MDATAQAHHFRVGARLGCPLGTASFLYLALTPHAAHRPLLLLVTALGAVLAAVVTVGPVRRRIERGNVNAHMAVWCASFALLAAVLCLLDGGLSSPFLAIFFVSVTFAATALPIAGVVLVSGLDLVALGGVGLYDTVGRGHSAGALLLWGAGLIATTFIATSVCNDRSRRVVELRRSREDIVHRLARVVEFRDNDTGGHVERMSRYGALVAEALGWTPAACRELQLAAALHDVGKVAVPDSILLKPGSLTAEERELMQHHARVGYDMLAGSGSELLDLAATIALTHHERFDGTGYPCGLRGEEIPLAGRIVSVADVFDALTSDRVYKPALEIDEALEVIREGRGTQFDPRVVDAFVEQLDAITALYLESADASRPPVALAA